MFLAFKNGVKSIQTAHYRISKFFTYVTKTRPHLSTCSRKQGNYNGTFIFEIDIVIVKRKADSGTKQFSVNELLKTCKQNILMQYS